MKKPLLIGIICLLSFCFSTVKAQTDTTKYDLGRVQVDKNLTQSITIKVADLERMPFSSLSEAINVWLYGVYGSSATYVPVVDGVMMSDINTLSIYDIDEITLVQNAATALNGASPQQLLLLIKTKRNHDGKKYGFEAAGQTNVIALHTTPPPANASYTVSSALQLYNQYYLSSYVNTGKIHAGVSADFQRDGIPVEKLQPTENNQPATNSGDAAALNQYKFNGYLDANLGKSTLSINAGYVPQNSNDNYGDTISGGHEKVKENIYYVNAKLESSFSGFQNTLTGSYEHYKGTNDVADVHYEYYYNNYEIVQSNQNISANASNYTLKDNLSRTFRTGGWVFEPNINLMYRTYKNRNATSDNGTYIDEYNNIFAYQDTAIGASHEERITTLTPALSINYHNIIAIQGGFEGVLSNTLSSNTLPSGSIAPDSVPPIANHKPQKFYPFLSATWNAIGRNREKDSFVLSFFGSYAKTASYEPDNSYMLPFSFSSVFTSVSPKVSINQNSSNLNLYTTSKQWQFGTNIILWKNKLAFSYVYNSNELNYLLTEAYYTLQPGYTYGLETISRNYPSKLIIQRIGFDINWKQTAQFSWKTNLNTSFVKTELDVPTYFNEKNHFATGGLTNRLDSKRTFVGIDILYLFQGDDTNGAASIPHYHAFNLQNLYYGKRYKINGDKTLEIFANMRSMIEDRSPTLLDYRKYYGLGFKLGI